MRVTVLAAFLSYGLAKVSRLALESARAISRSEYTRIYWHGYSGRGKTWFSPRFGKDIRGAGALHYAPPKLIGVS